MAIFTFFLASGIRKGGGDDTVTFFVNSITYLESYISVREKKYRALRNEDTLFLTYFKGECRPITVSTIKTLLIATVAPSASVFPLTSYAIVLLLS